MSENIIATITPTSRISVSTFSEGGRTLSELTDVDLQGVNNGSFLIYKDNEFVARQITGDISISVDGVVTLAPNYVTLGTDTSGAYVSTVTGTPHQVLVSGSGDETAQVVLSLPQSISISSSPTFQNITLNGVINNSNLTTQLNSKADSVDLNLHISDVSNPHAVTATQVGLGAVDNTSDANKPISIATQAALDNKVNVVSGQGLSDQNYTTVEKNKLAGIADGATANSTDAHLLSRANHTGSQSYTTITGLGTLATQSGTFSGSSSGTNTGDQTITLTGDATGSGAGSFAVTLKNTGTAGTYNNVVTGVTPFTTDAQGRISSVGNTVTITPSWNSITDKPTTVGGYGITDAVKTTGDQTIYGVKTFDSIPHVPNLNTTSSSSSAVNKAYVDNIASGIHVHAEAHVILKAATLAVATGGTVAYTNGTDGVGAKLVVSGGSTIIDGLNAVCGVDLDLTSGVNGSRIIVAAETNAAHNGIYTISAPRELTRAVDADTPPKMNGGDFVFVTHGTGFADTSWIVSEPVTIVGTSPVVFLQFSGAGAYDAGNGLTRDGTIFSITNTGVNTVSTTYGSGTMVPVITVNPQGQITSVTPTTVPTFDGYDYEIHVSQIDGDDTTGNGDLLTPVASITKALTLVGSGRKTIVIHPGGYTENPSITVQYTTLTTYEQLGANTVIYGTLSTSTGCTIAGLKMTNLTVTAPAGAGNVNILNCEISGTFTKNSNATYTTVRLCDMAAANITGSGLVSFFGGNPNTLTVNNAAANVIVKGAVSVSPVLTAGSLNIVDSVVVASGTYAISSAASSFITLANSQILVSALNNVAPVSLLGFYSIFNCVYDKPGSILAAASGTGGSTNSIDYFQYINADKFITQGGTSTQYVKGDGSLDSTSATNWSNHISDETLHLTSAQNTLLDGITVTSTKINYLSDVTSTIQSQLDGKSLTSHGHGDVTTSIAGFMSAGDKTKLNAISGSNTGDQTITLSGDATGSGTALLNVTMASTGVLAGEYNSSATSVTPFTVDVKGRITAVDTPIVITPNWNSVTNKPTTLSGYDISDAVDLTSAQTISGIKDFTNSPTVPLIPTASGHAASKAYVDTLSEGLHVHAAVHAILTQELADQLEDGTYISYTNGTNGVGAKLATGSSVAWATVFADSDIATGNRVIIAGQSTSAHNGIYVISSDTELTRASDFNTPTEMAGGDFVFVTHGTYADTGWVLSEPVLQVGVSPVIFTQFSGAGTYEAGDGLVRDGTIFSVNSAGNDRIVVDIFGIDLAKTGTPAGTYRSVTVDAYGRVTAASNPTTLNGYGITDAATSTALSNHISDATVHLTSTQNTLLDGVTVTSEKVNYLTDVTSNIQGQLDAKQPLDSDLTAIAGLTGTSGLLRKTGTDTWTLDTNTYSVSGHTHVTSQITDLYQPSPQQDPDATSNVTVNGTLYIKAGAQRYEESGNDNNWLGYNSSINRWQLGDNIDGAYVTSTSDGLYPWLTTWDYGYNVTKYSYPRVAGAPLASTASEGVSNYAAHADHIHPLPTAAEIGAASLDDSSTIIGLSIFL